MNPLVEVHTTLGRPVLPITPFRGAALLLRVLVVLTGFVQGIATVCLYAAIRPRFGAGPSTAAIAALSVWFLTSWMHLVWAVFTAVPIADALVPLVVNLPLVVLAGLAGRSEERRVGKGGSGGWGRGRGRESDWRGT